MSSRLKLSFFLLASGILLLMTGASPILGVSAVYGSGVFLALGVATLFLSLWAAFPLLRRKNLGLFLVHIGVVCLILGGLLDWAKEKKYTFSLYTGPQYSTEVVFDEKLEQTHPLGFRFFVDDFKHELYPQQYALYSLKNKGSGIDKKLENAWLKDGILHFPKHKKEVALSQLQNTNKMPHLILEPGLIVLPTPPADKYFGARFTIQPPTGEKFSQELAVNKPIDHMGWRFYLVSHGQDQLQRPFVRLTARQAPGRIWASVGMYCLLSGAFLFGFGLFSGSRRSSKHAA